MSRFRRVGLTWEITIGTVTAPHLTWKSVVLFLIQHRHYSHIVERPPPYTIVIWLGEIKSPWTSDARCGAQLISIGTVTAYFAHPLMQVPTLTN